MTERERVLLPGYQLNFAGSLSVSMCSLMGLKDSRCSTATQMPMLTCRLANHKACIAASTTPCSRRIASPCSPVFKFLLSDQALRQRSASGSSASTATLTSIFDIATGNSEELNPCVSELYHFGSGLAGCHVTPQLEQKFGMFSSPGRACAADFVCQASNTHATRRPTLNT